jgi:ADP-heptose:LPS heptosyltransferase
MSSSYSRRFKRQASSWLARLARRRRLTPAQLLALRPACILIVRQHNQMGDMVCATPALRAIRETWPEAETALVTAPVNHGVVADNPHLDRVVTFDQRVWRRPGRLFGFLREIRDLRPELAFVLSSVSFSVTSAWIAAASGARYIVGSDSRPFGWDVSRHAFSLEMPSTPELDRHAVAHSLAPLQAVGVTTDDLFPVLQPAPAQLDQADAILRDLNLASGFWALHPGAGKRQNIWPAAGFADVARRARQAGHQVLILHGPADREPLAEVVRLLGADLGPQLRVAPPCPVGVGAALLQRADRFVCNDTGVMHMAGALRVPTVALFGPTDPKFWQPPAPEVVVVRSPHQSKVPDQGGFEGDEFGWMQNITPETVWEAWSGLPGRSPARKEG